MLQLRTIREGEASLIVKTKGQNWGWGNKNYFGFIMMKRPWILSNHFLVDSRVSYFDFNVSNQTHNSEMLYFETPLRQMYNEDLRWRGLQQELVMHPRVVCFVLAGHALLSMDPKAAASLRNNSPSFAESVQAWPLNCFSSHHTGVQALCKLETTSLTLARSLI